MATKDRKFEPDDRRLPTAGQQSSPPEDVAVSPVPAPTTLPVEAPAPPPAVSSRTALQQRAAELERLRARRAVLKTLPGDELPEGEFAAVKARLHELEGS